MPIYEYRCEKCNGIKEQLELSDDETPPICTECNIEMVKKPSVSSFQLTGTGWYQTDFKSKPSKNKK